MNTRTMLTAALLLATAVPAARAATVLTYYEKPSGSQAGAVERRMVLAGPHVRMETSAPEGKRLLLFDAESGILYVIDEAKRSYTELHRTVVPMNLEESKTGPGPANPSPDMVAPDGTAYKKVDSGFIVNGFRADKYEGTRNGRKVEELYVADPKALGIAAGDLTTLHTMAEAFAEQGQRQGGRLSLTAEVPGVPVRTIRFEGGKPVLQIDLASVRQEEVPQAQFELPAGLTRLAQGAAAGH